MTTPFIHARVSLATALPLVLFTAACAGAPARLAIREPIATVGTSPASEPATPEAAEPAAAMVRFENQGHDQARVYLVDSRGRQWLLGRVAPGARSALRVPHEALPGATGPMRLEVVAGDHAAQGPGTARTTVGAEPLAIIVSQRWSFAQTMTGGTLTSLPMVPASSAP